MGWPGHLAGQAIVRRGPAPGEARPPDPIAIDEHYRRAAWVTAEVDDEVSAGIRAGGDADAQAGPAALVDRVRSRA